MEKKTTTSKVKIPKGEIFYQTHTFFCNFFFKILDLKKFLLQKKWLIFKTQKKSM